MNAMADDLFEEYLDLPDLAAQQRNAMWRFTSARAHDAVQPPGCACPKHVYPAIAPTAGK
jgi:hypothetical protein